MVNSAYFDRHGTELIKIAPLAFKSLYSIYTGGNWRHDMKRLITKHGIDPAIYSSRAGGSLGCSSPNRV